MSAQIKLIHSNWKPKILGSVYSKEEKSVMLENGFYTGALWEAALIKRGKKEGWVATDANSNSDATLFNVYGESEIEIRTVSKHGFGSVQSNVSGSKGTKANKLKSFKEKFRLLGESGVFALIDITNASTKGAFVYLFSTEDYLDYFGDKRVHVSYAEFQTLVERRCVK